MDDTADSHVRGSTAHTLHHLTIGSVLGGAARAWPERDAFIVRHQNVRYSYRQLNAWVYEVACGLIACGL